MKAYTIFDDFPQSSISLIEKAGIELIIQPKGKERPQGDELKKLLDTYDIVFISTAQKMPEEMFADVTTPKIIGTASSGIDHIHIPEDKKGLIRIANATHANRSTVTEHTFALILALRKQLLEGRETSAKGLSKKVMKGKPVDLLGSTFGVIGAGGIASTVLRMGKCFGMRCLSWTLHPESHQEMRDEGVEFVSVEELVSNSDIISVNIPMSDITKNLINSERVAMMKDTATFVTTSRLEITDNKALLNKACSCPTFSVGMDVDAAGILGLWDPNLNNVIITPHIGGGTIESRIRLFNECCENVIKAINNAGINI